MTDEKMTRYLENWYWCLVGKDVVYSESPGHRDWSDALETVMDWIHSIQYNGEASIEAVRILTDMGPDGFDIRICQGHHMAKHVIDSIIIAVEGCENEESHSIH